MFELRDMELLEALARHRHFARAAQECGISQPAFSMRIRNLEAALGVPVVRRGNRFQGFAEEGEIVLRRARVLLEEARMLERDVHAVHGKATGVLTLGVVPTALAFAAKTTVRLRKAQPELLVRVLSRTSLEIQADLERGTLDAGLTYSDGLSGDLFRAEPLYEESYVLVVPEDLAPQHNGEVTWQEAAELPLSLLEPQMQNRRILNRIFRDAGVRPNVVAETNAFSASIIMVREGFSGTILPHVLVDALGVLENVHVLPLATPATTRWICLATVTAAQGHMGVSALRQIVLRQD